jgi:hypothetical protein
MPVNRIVLLVLVVGGLTLFAFSNLSPVLPLVFLGRTTVGLPLAAWIGGAIAAGAISSFCLQLLSSWHRGYSTRRFEERGEVPPRTRSFDRESRENPASESQTRYTPPPEPPQTSTSSDASDWEEPVSDQWDFDEQPTVPRANQKDFDQERPIRTPGAERTSYEAKQEPKTGYKSGSVYSFSYREPSESGVGKAEAVYDANYRVITPPDQKPAEPEEDEDWGFEDDEEFNDEGENKARRR